MGDALFCENNTIDEFKTYTNGLESEMEQDFMDQFHEVYTIEEE